MGAAVLLNRRAYTRSARRGGYADPPHLVHVPRPAWAGPPREFPLLAIRTPPSLRQRLALGLRAEPNERHAENVHEAGDGPRRRVKKRAHRTVEACGMQEMFARPNASPLYLAPGLPAWAGEYTGGGAATSACPVRPPVYVRV